jgi:hypothetical protein
MLYHLPLTVAVVVIVTCVGVVTAFGLLAIFGPEPKARYDARVMGIISIRLRREGRVNVIYQRRRASRGFSMTAHLRAQNAIRLTSTANSDFHGSGCHGIRSLLYRSSSRVGGGDSRTPRRSR